MTIEIGKVFFFGYKKTPNTVVSVGNKFPDGSIPVVLRGPRGGESFATVYPSGMVRKN